MQKGTARKWIECLQSCTHRYDNTQLAFPGLNGEIFMSPLGVLCRFLDPHGFQLVPETGGYHWHGEMFALPQPCLKRGEDQVPLAGTRLGW